MSIILPLAIMFLGLTTGGILIGPMVAATYGLMSLISRFIIKVLGLDVELIFPELVGHVGVVRNPNALNKYTSYPLSVEIEKAGLYGNSFWHGNKIAACSSEEEIPVGTNVKVIEADYWSFGSLVRNSPVLKVVPFEDETKTSDDVKLQGPVSEEESKEEIITKSEVEEVELPAEKESGSIGDALRGGFGSILLIIACFSFFIACFSFFFEGAGLPRFLIVSSLLMGLVYLLRGTFFPNMRARMHAREAIRFTYVFIYFIIFFGILMSHTGWYAPDITISAVIIFSIFFLGSSFIAILPKFTPTKEDTKDVEFVTFFIAFTIINFTFFMLIFWELSLWEERSFQPIIIFFSVLILLFLSYNYILEFVRRHLITKVDESYSIYQKEKNTGSLLYIGFMSFIIVNVPNGVFFIILLLGSLYIVSLLKTHITGTSEWETPLGNLTKYEFSLFIFNIVILSTLIYHIHDNIEFDPSNNNEMINDNSCESLKSGYGVVRSGYWDRDAFIYNCDLSYTDLKNEKMSRTIISDTSFNSASLRNADLSDAEISGNVDFTNADLYGADLTNVECYNDCTVTFVNANLRYVNFGYAYLPNSNFQGSDLRGADFTEATFPHAVFDENTIIDKNALAGITLDNSDFSNFNLSGYDLNGTSLKGVNLSGRDFSGYDFTGANFNGANLSGTNLSGSTLTDVSGFDLQGCPASMPDNWICLENNLFGPETTFRGLDFSDANLSNMDLKGSNFSSANLKNTYFLNTNLTNSYFSYSNFDSIEYHITWYEEDPDNVTEWFEHIGFEGDFDDYLVELKTESAVDLSNANLSGANLSYANFAYANLTNADLNGADLNGVRWYYTTCPDGTNSGKTGSCNTT